MVSAETAILYAIWPPFWFSRTILPSGKATTTKRASIPFILLAYLAHHLGQSIPRTHRSSLRSACLSCTCNIILTYRRIRVICRQLCECVDTHATTMPQLGHSSLGSACQGLQAFRSPSGFFIAGHERICGPDGTVTSNKIRAGAAQRTKQERSPKTWTYG